MIYELTQEEQAAVYLIGLINVNGNFDPVTPQLPFGRRVLRALARKDFLKYRHRRVGSTVYCAWSLSDWKRKPIYLWVFLKAYYFVADTIGKLRQRYRWWRLKRQKPINIKGAENAVQNN